MNTYLLLYLSTFVVMLPLDLFFINVLAKKTFTVHVGHLLGEPNMLAAAAFYVMYIGAIVIFASATATDWKQAALFGALLGFVCYGTFEFTNMALLKDWRWPLVAVDLAWGTVVTAIASTGGWLAAGWIGKQLA